MTVKELMEVLSHHREDLKVVVEGYEGGWEDLTTHKISTAYLARDYYLTSSFFGPHEDICNCLVEELEEAAEEHLLLRR